MLDRLRELPSQADVDAEFARRVEASQAVKTEAQAKKERRKQSRPDGGLLAFIRYFWSVLEPVTPLVEGWPLEAVCLHLEAVTSGKITRLLINVPPGFMKSLLVNVFWPAWEWGPMGLPHLRTVAFSYSPDLTERDNNKLLALVSSVRFRHLWGERFAIKKMGSSLITNDRTGSRRASSIGGVGTGERGDRVVCFPFGAKLATECGLLNIGDVVERRLSVMVWSFNRETRALELKRITAWHKNPGRRLVRVKTSDGRSVTCTEDHRILTKGGGYREASRLVSGDQLCAAPCGMLRSSSVVVRPKVESEVSPDLSCSDACDRGSTDAEFFGEHASGVTVSGRDLAHKFFGQVRRAVLERAVGFAIGNILSPRAVFQIAKMGLGAVAVLVSDLLSFGTRTDECFCHHLMHETVDSAAVESHRHPRVSLVEDGREYSARDIERATAAHHGARNASDFPGSRDLVDAKKSNHVAPEIVTVHSVDLIHEIPPETYCITVADNHNMVIGDGDGSIVCSNCDDPHNVVNMESEKERQSTSRWFRESMSNRLNDMQKSAIVVIMQRLHEDDVSGVILANEFDYCYLMIPMEFAPERYPVRDDVVEWGGNEIGWIDPRALDEDGHLLSPYELDQREGVLAWPERFPPEVIAGLKHELGPYSFSGQYSQNPQPRKGAIFDLDWWQLYEPPESGKFPAMEFVLASLDSAFTEKEENDPSGFVMLGVWRPLVVNQGTGESEPGHPQVMLLTAWRKHLRIHGVEVTRRPNETNNQYIRRAMPHWGLVEWVAHSCRRFGGADMLLIEAKASGIDVINEMKRLYGDEQWGLEGRQAPKDKVSRALAVQPTFSQEIVWAPATDWADMVQKEMAMFPKGRYKDLTDAMTHGIKWLREKGLIQRPEEISRLERARSEYRSNKPKVLYEA